MSLRSSHLMTLTTSVMCVSRLISLLMRCERSPTPVSVGVNTLWPCCSSKSDTRRQHQPPCHAPCTSTKVLRCAVCALDGVPPSAVALTRPAILRAAAHGLAAKLPLPYPPNGPGTGRHQVHPRLAIP